MPDEAKPPKTTAEQGVYIAWIFSDMKEIKDTLKSMQETSVGRLEFDEHVIWGKGIVKEHDERISAVEKVIRDDSSSVSHKVLKYLDKRLIVILATIVLGSFGYYAYIMYQANDAINRIQALGITSK